MLRWSFSINDEATNHQYSQDNSPGGNVFKHCFSSCIQTAENSAPFALITGIFVEIGQLVLGKDTLGESIKDQM